MIIVVGDRFELQELIFPVLRLVACILTVDYTNTKALFFLDVENKASLIGLLETNTFIVIYTEICILLKHFKVMFAVLGLEDAYRLRCLN